MARAKQDTHLHRFASRVDFQYITAFVLGSLAPLAGGFVASFVSVSLWNVMANGETYTNFSLTFVNSASLAAVCLVYLGILALMVHFYRRFGVRSTGRSMITAMIAAGSLAILAIVISLNSFDYGPEVSVYLDATSMALFGLGYVLGWWVIKRYAKLGK